MRVRWVAIATIAGCFGSHTESQPGPSAPEAARPEEPVRFSEDAADGQGLKITLSETTAAGGPGEQVPVAAATPLDAAVVRGLLARVEAPATGADDRVPFSLRPGSPPPPLSGEDVAAPWPPPDGPAPAETASGPLQVVRFAPEGEVPMAPHVTLTFDQPMVALTSQEEAAKQVPATLTPTPPGRWRWLGTKTLLFDPEPRLPMATEFTVVVPKGTASATGGALAEDVRFTFATPPPSVTFVHPSDGPHDLRPVVVIGFDQAVDPAAIAAHTSLRAGDTDVPLTPAADADVERDPTARALLEACEPKRCVAFVPSRPLEQDRHYRIRVAAGAPSAEGPRTTPRDQGGEFFTYPPLRFLDVTCAWDDRCPPTHPWYVRFNNPLDADALDPAALRIEPELPGLSVQPAGDALVVTGAFVGRTTYRLTIPGSLRDTFGQTLGADRVVELRVGPAEATLTGPSPMAVLDPSAAAKLSVFSVNHEALRVRIHQVEPADFAAWAKWMERLWYEDARPGPLPGRRVFEGTVRVEGERDRQAETALDLTPYLKGGHGQFVVFVEPTRQPAERWNRQYLYTWVQVTDLGLVAFADPTRLVAWASDLATGAPVADVELTITPSGWTGRTGKDGLASLDLGPSSAGPQVLVARKGDDVALLPQSAGYYGESAGWLRWDRLDQLRWYVADDRGLYKPGETAKIKGWLRRFEPGVGGDVEALGDDSVGVEWVLTGSRGNELGRGRADVSGLGGFAFEVAIPKDTNLGTANLQITAVESGPLDGLTTWHALEIQEFRAPEYEVTATAEPGPHVLGTGATVDVAAAYFAGGALPNAEVYWNVYATPATYAPPGHDGFSFGAWTPWWMAWSHPPAYEVHAGVLAGRTDAAGQHHLAMHFDAMNPTRPYQVRAEATVFDVDRQGWTSSATVLVHPSDRYVGLRTARSFVDKGKEVVVDVIVSDIDGGLQPGTPVEVRFARVEHGYAGGVWQEQEKDATTCAVTAADAPVTCRFRPEIGGEWRVTASVRDGHGRRNDSELRVWVSGAETAPARDVTMERVTLVPEQRDVAVGDTLRLLVQSPFAPAEGVLTVRRSGLAEVRRFRMESATTTLEVPIDEAAVPNLTVQVDLAGAAPRAGDDGEPRPDLPKRVAHAQGAIEVAVPPLTRTLNVAVEPAAARVGPGAKTSVKLRVTGPDGEAVPDAELAVVIVDEAILSLTGYRLPDPLSVFYAARSPDVTDHHLRAYVVLTDPIALPAVTPTTGAAGGRDGVMLEAMGYASGGVGSLDAPMAAPAAPPPPPKQAAPARERAEAKKSADEEDTRAPEPSGPAITVRSNFSATALFAPAVRTGGDGRAEVDVTLPDSLTRWRVMVVAAAGGRRFGAGDAAITTRLPLMVQPSAPRFLNFGDRAELPFVVRNQTDTPLTVDVALRATNLALLDSLDAVAPEPHEADRSEGGRRVVVPANDRVEVRFPAASLMAGTTRLQVVAASGDHADAATVSLPVRTPATTEAFATYGEIDAGAVAQPVVAPSDVWPQFGGLEVTTSSTQLQALTDAVLYLQSYPYDCNEQIASRVLAIASLRDVLTAFEAEGLPPAAELEASVARDLERLERRQNGDGGFAFWRRGDESWPFLSIHVANALARAKGKGYAVPPAMWSRSLGHLQRIEHHIPRWYSREARWFLRAYALDVRRRMGDADPQEARRLYREAGGTQGLGIEALAWLLPTLHDAKATAETDAILRHFGNRVAETAAGAHFVTAYDDGAQVLLHSDRRADGIALEALIEARPKSDLVAKVTRGLLDHRTKGHWGSTQENAFILLALDRYFRVYEKETPDFVARVWLGDGYVGDHAFRGRTTERVHFEVPMGVLTESPGPEPLVLQRDGAAGRLYWRAGLRYAPKRLSLEPADYGFAVERQYEAIDDPRDVTRGDDGTWRIRAGARVRVRVTMVAPMRRYHVALVDPLPAGLEVQNPELATTGTLPQDPNDTQAPYWWWWRTWYEHENLRDDRVEAFASLLWDGVFDYTYVARATTPGRYVVPPAKAEEMYHPETFGRSGTDRVVIE